MATEGEVTLRINLVGQGGAAGGGGVRPSGGASPAAGGDLGAAIRALEQAIARLGAKQAAKQKGEGEGKGAGAVAGFVGGVTASVTSAMLDQLTGLISVLVTTQIPGIISFLGRISLADERAAAQQVGALTSQYAMLGGDPSPFRGTLIAQATRAARLRREEQVTVDTAAGLTGLESGVDELGNTVGGAMWFGQRIARRLAMESAREAAETIWGMWRQ